MMNVVNGGAHARQLDRPAGVHGRPGRRADVLRGAADRRRGLPRAEGVLHERGLATGVGDEGGFAPDLPSSEEAIEAILEAAERAGHRERVAIALDPAATELFARRRLPLRGPREDDAPRWSAFWAELAERYPIVSIEDGLAEDDWDGWAALTRALGDRVQLVGDDLFVTNAERLRRGIERGVAQRDPRQGEPDRDADRDARGDRARAAERLRGGHLAPLGRDRGHDDRRPRGRDRRRPDQDRRARRAPTASRSTTSCCGSRRSSATARPYPGLGRVPASPQVR